MIHFKTVKWQNFLSTGNDFIEISLERSKSTLIRGTNGVGKSVFLDAIFFVLYNRPFRQINKPLLINSITNKNMLVEIEFSTNGKEYRVRRGMKPAVFEIYQDDRLIDQSADIKEYQELLEKNILKMSGKTFSQVAILGMANYSPFMQLATADRRSVVEDLLDLQVFSTMNILLKEKAVENKNLISESDYNLTIQENKIDINRKHLTGLKLNQQDIIDSKQDTISSFEEKIKVAHDSLLQIDDERKKKLDSISDKESLQNKKKQLLLAESKGEDLRRSINREIQFFSDNNDCPTCKQGIEHTFKHSEIESKKTRLDGIKTSLDKIESELSSTNERLNEINTTEEEITVLNSRISVIMSDVRSWNTSSKILREEIDGLRNSTFLLEDLQKEIDSLLKEQSKTLKLKKDLLDEREVIDVSLSLLKDSGIKSKLIKKYIPKINEWVNSYLSDMNFFVNFELDEKFNETIKSRHRDAFTYYSFSEGEKLRLDIALMMTWRKLAISRNSASTNLLIMDEILDSSADAEGTESLLGILNGLESTTNVFVISHKGEEFFDRFHSQIRFEKVKNFTRIVKDS